jgi:hypothetical protein
MFVLLYKLIPLVALVNRGFVYWLFSSKSLDKSTSFQPFYGKIRTLLVVDFSIKNGLQKNRLFASSKMQFLHYLRKVVKSILFYQIYAAIKSIQPSSLYKTYCFKALHFL